MTKENRFCKKLVFQTLNLPRHILNFVVGPQHPIALRLAVGLSIALIATLISDDPKVLKMLAELIRAFGYIPVLEFIAEVIREENKADTKERQPTITPRAKEFMDSRAETLSNSKN